jgi:hypothetical protein
VLKKLEIDGVKFENATGASNIGDRLRENAILKR